MGQSIVITSGKGGTGKSTLAKNLGLLLCSLDQRVALVDMDMGMRSLDLMLGIQDRVVYDLADVAEGVCRLRQALVRVRDGQELFLLSAAQTRGSDAVTPVQMEQIIGKLKQRFDFVLIDCPAGVGRGFRNAAAGADGAILVAQPDPVSLRDAERVVGLLQRCDIRNPLLVVNRVTGREGEEYTPQAMAHALSLELLGFIPEDAQQAMARPGQGSAGRALARIAGRLLGQHIPIERPKRPGYVRRVLRALAGK